MKLKLITISVVLAVQAFGATQVPTWEELCYLLTVKRESKVFHTFRDAYGLQEFVKREGDYSGPSGVMVGCVGDDIETVGIQVAAGAIKLPFGLSEKDDLLSAAQKLGIHPTAEQRANAHDYPHNYLELRVPEHRLTLFFHEGRLVEVWRAKGDRTARTQDSFTYAAKSIGGKIFLSLNSLPERLIGPFVRVSKDVYEYTTGEEGVHRLSKQPGYGWSYSWSYIQMEGQSVDGGILDH